MPNRLSHQVPESEVLRSALDLQGPKQGPAPNAALQRERSLLPPTPCNLSSRKQPPEGTCEHLGSALCPQSSRAPPSPLSTPHSLCSHSFNTPGPVLPQGPCTAVSSAWNTLPPHVPTATPRLLQFSAQTLPPH